MAVNWRVAIVVAAAATVVTLSVGSVSAAAPAADPATVTTPSAVPPTVGRTTAPEVTTSVPLQPTETSPAETSPDVAPVESVDRQIESVRLRAPEAGSEGLVRLTDQVGDGTVRITLRDPERPEVSTVAVAGSEPGVVAFGEDGAGDSVCLAGLSDNGWAVAYPAAFDRAADEECARSVQGSTSTELVVDLVEMPR